MRDMQENNFGAMDDNKPMLFDHPKQQQDSSWPNAGSSTRDHQPDRWPWVEEVENKESDTQSWWLKDFLLPVGTLLQPAQSYFEIVVRHSTYESKILSSVYMSSLATQPFEIICNMYQRRFSRTKMET